MCIVVENFNFIFFYLMFVFLKVFEREVCNKMMIFIKLEFFFLDLIFFMIEIILFFNYILK